MKTVKCLSILQPWASLCVAGEKRIETRSWNTKYRGVLYIHASAKDLMWSKFDSFLLDNLSKIGYCTKIGHNLATKDLPLGAIIGKVELIETIRFDKETIKRKQDFHFGNIFEYTTQEIAFGDYSPNRFGWLLANPVMFDKPIPAKGKLGIWNWIGVIE